MDVRVRFAPSPTGFLHIGSVRTALFNWLYARHTGGTFVLRIEDTDIARNTEQSLNTILDGLKWLGLHHDEGPYFQSQRAKIYRQRTRQLLDAGMAYERDGAIRFKMPREPITVPDLIAGNVTRELADRELQDPDFVIVRSDGNPVFHLVNVVDDLEMKITHVIRGEDHLSNTPKHIALFRAFGVEPPQYAHIPMILNPDGTKMSKSDPDPGKARLASLSTYIEDGYVPEAVRNYLCLLGWSPKDNREKMDIEEIKRIFDLPQVLRTNARFDVAKLKWMSGEYIHELSMEEFVKRAQPFLRIPGPPPDRTYLHALLRYYQLKIQTFKELLDQRIDYWFIEEYPFDPEAVKKSCSAPQTGERLLKLADAFAAVRHWDLPSLETALKSLATELGIKNADLIHPCRVAVSGQSVGMSLYHMLEVLGRDRVLARLRRAAEKFRP
jgi:glutamyl-tRNA synthetase